jgi:cyclic beta-1,2-glucan synthetase
MYRAGIEGLLGMTRQGTQVRFAPCFPKDWPQVEMRLTLGNAPCTVTVLNPRGVGTGVTSAVLNGVPLICDGGGVTLAISQLGGVLILGLG